MTFLFIHLGSKYPKYLLSNISRTRKLFPLVKIVLYGEIDPSDSWMKSNKIIFVKHSPDLKFYSAFSFGNFEKTFRNGYWKTTLERLICINAYHKNYPNEKVLHVESDVILFPNFPLLELSSLKKLAWPNFSESADIGSLIYSPSGIQSKKLSELIISEIKKSSCSDMDILFKIRKRLAKDFQILPTLHSKLPELMNRNAHINNENLENKIHGKVVFEGIFDGLAFGSWIGGFDPRNRFGFTKIHTRDLIDSGISLVDPSHTFFELTPDSTLSICNSEVRIPIYNLHIHSKNVKLLSIYWELELIRLLKIENNSQRIISFKPQILLRLIASNLKNRTIKDFLLHIPIIKRFRA
jgi:hypothetical protein